MKKEKIKIEKLSETKCKVTKQGSEKELILEGDEAIMTISLSNNAGKPIPEEFLMFALRTRKPLPKLPKKMIDYIQEAQKTNKNIKE